MTGKQDKPHIGDALNKLYGSGFKDLTSDGLVDSLSQLRKEGAAEARRVERVLDDHLKQHVFRRRQREWFHTSEGTRAKLVLLPRNLHIKLDVGIIRNILKLPGDQIKPDETNPIWKDLKGKIEGKSNRSIRMIVEENLATQWIFLHRQAANNCMYDDMEDLLAHLSSEQRNAAINTSQINLGADSIPDWLRCSPNGPAPYNNTKVPLDWVAGRLVERHFLPWRAASPLALFILTENLDWITNIEPMNAEVSYDDNTLEDPDAFTITVKEIDEFVRKADWEHIWNDFILPKQKKMWGKRGKKPRGRRTVDIDRLKDNISLYSQMVFDGKLIADFLKESISYELDDADQETIRRTLNDLDDLLDPNKIQIAKPVFNTNKL
ncbi:hypothetical protein ACFLUZ_00915 [Chloroflexota bacterium]